MPTLKSGARAHAETGFVGNKADTYAQTYADETPAGFALRMRRQRVLQLFDKPGGKVLDVGCGPGEMVRDLLNLGCEFWGVDPSARMIEICRQRHSECSKAHFQLGQAESLNFADGIFDAVICMGVIDGLQSAGAAVREMARILKPGGTMIITFSNHHSPYAWWKAFVYYRALAVVRRILHPRLKHDPIFVRRKLFTPRTATNLLAGLGTRVERVVGYFYNVIPSPFDEIWPAATLWVNRKLEKARDGKADSLAAGFIVKAVNIAGAVEVSA